MNKHEVLREDGAFKKYIAECDEFAIVPDVAGAFHWVWEKFSKLDQKQIRQITNLILPEGFCISSPLESAAGFSDDIEHRFQVSDGERRIGVVIILTELRSAYQGPPMSKTEVLTDDETHKAAIAAKVPTVVINEVLREFSAQIQQAVLAKLTAGVELPPHVAVVEDDPATMGSEVWFAARCSVGEVPIGTKLFTEQQLRQAIATMQVQYDKLYNLWFELLGTTHKREQAEARAVELEKDAARYRWLRNRNAYFPEENQIVGFEELDEAIDAAMKGQQP